MVKEILTRISTKSLYKTQLEPSKYFVSVYCMSLAQTLLMTSLTEANW